MKTSGEVDFIEQLVISAIETGGNTPSEVLDSRYYKPAAGLSDWWDNNSAIIMLYTVIGKTDETDGKKSVYPLYWTKVSLNAGDFHDGEPIDSQVSKEALWQRLQGFTAYGNQKAIPTILRVPVNDNGYTHNFFGDIAPPCAFDLRLFCRRYEWVARPLINDPQHPGEMMVDRGHKYRGYFNTKCWASVRQIAPVLPRVIA